MPKLTPKRTAALARRTGLSFRAVRGSRHVAQLVDLEAKLSTTTATIVALIARIRAYKLAIKCAATIDERIDLRITRERAQHKLDRLRLIRDRIKRDLVPVKLAIEARAFAAGDESVVEESAPAPTPEQDEVNARLRKLFNA